MEVLNVIKDNKKQLIEGHINCIPNPFKGLQKYYSGIFPGALIGLTAETSVGKTSLAKYIYVFSVADYILSLKNPSDLDYLCYWFGLEESVEEFDISIIQYALSKYHNKNKTQDELLSRIDPLDEETIKMIESSQVQDFFKLVKSFVLFDDTTSNPTGIYKKCREISLKRGKHVNKTIETSTGPIEVYSHYEPTNPHEIVSVVIDNVNILEPEKNELGIALDLSGSIDRMVNSYARKQMTKHWNWHVCCVQQQQMAAGDLNHIKAGRLEPEPQKLGDNIKVARSYQVIIGLFSPYKHKLANYYNYQILNSDKKEGLEDCFRTVHICKNRFGRTGVAMPSFFNPKGFSFETICSPNDVNTLNNFINKKNSILNV
jgi:hypothetical protein